jgi:hypothetical protein
VPGDWIDTLVRGSFEITLPELALMAGESAHCRGRGRVSWHGGSGVQVHAITNGADEQQRRLSGGFTAPGKLIPRNVPFSSGRRAIGMDGEDDSGAGQF